VGCSAAEDVKPEDQTTLKASPWGQGWLMYTGALQDAKSFYCPSAKDVNWGLSISWSAKYGKVWGDQGLAPGGPADTPYNENVRSWQSAGGTSPRIMTHGNWKYIHACGTGRWAAGYWVFSQYAYRNQPIWIAGNATEHLTIAFTKPRVTTHAHCPPFKTQRRLQGRALVSDNFQKGHLVNEPGYAYRCHKDGPRPGDADHLLGAAERAGQPFLLCRRTLLR